MSIPFNHRLLHFIFLLIMGFSLSSCSFLDVLFNSPEHGTYKRSDGTEYIVKRGPRYFTLKGPNNLCVGFNHLKTDPDENRNMNLGGVGCSEESRKIRWKGTFSLKYNDRILINPSNEEPFEIIYVGE